MPEIRPLTDGEHGIELGADGTKAVIPVERQNIANREMDVRSGVIMIGIIFQGRIEGKFSKPKKSSF